MAKVYKHAVKFKGSSLMLFLDWTSSQENLSSGVRKQQRSRPACSSAKSDQRI